ncbi:Amino acid/polyamine transporter I [Penicillium manginii]|uniref:Amino acid/polyamine transporter I n=1 Tax=Penicillium manginii TaxID=203109 RepID=UPI0025487A5B|nr:Amino acid/polyamine transporter I [Penicillium manginii]KAJ5754402.1 Amino acid/polyamine transporter I [Penicillium manginii]
METIELSRRLRSSNDDNEDTGDLQHPPNTPIRSALDAARQQRVAIGFADIYGSLTSRQLSVITIGSAIGTGLMVTSGLAMSMSGPPALLISYSVVGFTVYLVLSALGEVAAWLPDPYTVADQAVRFCDPALGFSLGWIYWLKYAIITPNQLVAASLVISFWVDTDFVNPGVWITIFLVTIIILNSVHHQIPSQVEFYVSSFKLVVMAALMILSFVIALGGGPDRDIRGFRYFRESDDLEDDGSRGALGRFFLACGTMSPAAFAYVGSERSGIVARAPNTKKAISRSINHTFYRLLVFHLLGITLVGMMEPRKFVSAAWIESLSLEYSRKAKNPAASPFVAALCLAHIAVAPHLLNACILIFVLSIANYDLFLATRALCDLSVKRRAPKFLSHTNRKGVPFYALAICASLTTIAYVNVGRDSSRIFSYFVKMVTMLGLLTWMSILVTHISFVRARKAQGISDSVLVFRASFGISGSWLGILLCLFISSTMIFNSIDIRQGKATFDYRSFVAAYIAVPFYLILYVGYKLAVKSKHISATEADLWSGKSDIQPGELSTT